LISEKFILEKLLFGKTLLFLGSSLQTKKCVAIKSESPALSSPETRMFVSLRAQNDGLKVQSKPRKRDAVDAQLDANIANLQTVAQHLVESNFEAQTAYHDDHTFSGKF
jgi:hypothetical protein